MFKKRFTLRFNILFNNAIFAQVEAACAYKQALRAYSKLRITGFP